MADCAWVLEDALPLPIVDRAGVAHELLRRLDDEDSDAAAAWTDELGSRIDEIEAGTAELHDWDRVRAPFRKVTSRYRSFICCSPAPGSFQAGKPIAAYLYLPRAVGAKAARTLEGGHGPRLDLDERGVLIGIEITTPSAPTVGELNDEEWAPSAAIQACHAMARYRTESLTLRLDVSQILN